LASLAGAERSLMLALVTASYWKGYYSAGKWQRLCQYPSVS